MKMLQRFVPVYHEGQAVLVVHRSLGELKGHIYAVLPDDKYAVRLDDDPARTGVVHVNYLSVRD